jgi:hypothetical protein
MTYFSQVAKFRANDQALLNDALTAILSKHIPAHTLFVSYRGALTASKVKMTSGWGKWDAIGLPNKITVSPDKTLLTRATPVTGRIMEGVGVAMITREKDVYTVV